MLARSTTSTGRPDAVDSAIAFVRDEVLPQVEAMPGCVGLSMLVERGSGTCIVTTAWSSQEALRTSGQQLAPVRSQAQQRLGTRLQVRTWQIGVLHRARTAPPGAWARVTWTRLQREQMDEHRDVFRSEVLPQIEQLPGFCSASLLLDRHTGRSAVAVAYESREALTDARATALALRTQALRRRHSELLDVVELEVVLAHLRVPETV